MSFTRKSKYVKVPFEINMANGVNDNFSVSFQPKQATNFRESDSYTKFIDDDYSKFLNDSLKNSNASKEFTGKKYGDDLETTYDIDWNKDLQQGKNKEKEDAAKKTY